MPGVPVGLANWTGLEALPASAGTVISAGQVIVGAFVSSTTIENLHEPVLPGTGKKIRKGRRKDSEKKKGK